MAENIRDTIARWAEDTQALLDGLTQVLEANDHALRNAQALSQRAEDAERRAQAAEGQAAKLSETLDELRRERMRLETALAQANAQLQTSMGAERAAKRIQDTGRPMMPPVPPAPPAPASPITRDAPAAHRFRLAPVSAAAMTSMPPVVAATPAAPPPAIAPAPTVAPAPPAAAPAPGSPLVSPRAATGPRRPHSIRFSAAMLDDLGGAATG